MLDMSATTNLPMNRQPRSVVDMLHRLPLETRVRIMDQLPVSASARLALDWNHGGQSRRKQRIPDGGWRYWLLLAGRGFGKTRVVSSFTHRMAMSGNYETGALLGATSDDVRGVLVDGESGIMQTVPSAHRPRHYKVDRYLLWPNGARTYLFSAEEPDRLRGRNLSYGGIDEIAAWKSPQDVWDQFMLTLRAGTDPRVAIATTPRPIPIIRKLASDPLTFLTTGTTYENFSNLAPAFVEEIVKAYEGTRLGQQELDGVILSDTQNALWLPEDIIYAPDTDVRALRRVVVGVDPTGSSTGDYCGIVVAGERPDGDYIVLEDASVSGSPEIWAGATVAAFDRWKADLVVAEVNFGGDMVEATLRNVAPNLPVRKVRASRGKVIRAEPIALLYQKHRVTHYRKFDLLETQLTQMSGDPSVGFTGSGSPDRLDALVWALHAMSGKARAPTGALPVVPGRIPIGRQVNGG